MAAQLVITLGRPFDVRAVGDDGKPIDDIWNVRRIIIPFADQASASAAMAEVSVHTDTVAEDFGPKVIQGTVIGDDHDHDQQLGDREVEALPPSVVPHVLPGNGADAGAGDL